MITERFDRRVMAAMEVALDRVCERWPNGGSHLLRKRVAQSIIRCAKTGNTSLDALVEAAGRAASLTRHSQNCAGVRPNWRDAA